MDVNLQHLIVLDYNSTIAKGYYQEKRQIKREKEQWRNAKFEYLPLNKMALYIDEEGDGDKNQVEVQYLIMKMDEIVGAVVLFENGNLLTVNDMHNLYATSEIFVDCTSK